MVDVNDSDSTAANGADAARAAGSGDEPGLAVTHFNFTHRVFQAPGARFLSKGHAHVPTFRVEMGDIEALIEIDVLRKEFGITPESPDGKLVDLAVAGLRYVVDIKPGDSIPSELLSGKASWTVSPKHKKIAEQRLQVQLLSWVSGKEMLLTDPGEIAMFLQQLENREKLRNAFRDAAVALGHAPDNTEPVIVQVELLARELCYIEALRDRYSLIPKIGEKLVALGKSYGNDRNGKMELNRIHGLLQTGIEEYTAAFTEVDAQTSEIISALKSIDRQARYIREKRDALHFLMMLWDPHVNNLDKWQARRTPETEKLLSALYRFLAPRYSAGRSILKRKTAQQGPASPASKNKAGAKKPAAPQSPAPAGARVTAS
ncbi:MAG: hypothetical protein AB7H70_11305 [Rhodospirillaceae bacterium]